MENKTSFERPEIGAFYLVPEPKTGRYTILSAFDRPGEDSAHLFLWDKVKNLLRVRFKGVDIDLISDSYMGLPRGRVSERSSKDWLVLHGDDFPLDEYKQEIISEYRLQDAVSINRVSWIIESHEKMNPREKAIVENILKIKITPGGFKMSKVFKNKGV